MAVTILTTDSEVTSDRARSEDARLWVRADDLPALTGWEIKPEGVCRGELCVPLPADVAPTVLVEREGATWLDVASFAAFVGQPHAHDAASDAWYFGPGPEARRGHLDTLEAPDFALPDLDGTVHRLSDLRGKKVLLALWASW
ncbi:MAG: redoxin domain-containing protein [Dehalococcoidia bacterium]|nr:redoxin domain-containing protein [Dehalococcoidia bacterium]